MQRIEQALAAHRQGRLDEARSLYEQALAEDGDSFDGLNLLGALCVQRGELPRAMALIERALALDASQPGTFYNLGLAQQGLRRLDDAQASYERALMLQPGHLDARNNLGNLRLAQGDVEGALQMYDEVIQRDPQHVRAHSNRGNALRLLHRPGDALASCDHALALDPRHADAWNNRGAALHAQRSTRLALQSFDHAIALDPAHADAHDNRSRLLCEVGDFDAAVESARRAIALRPSDARAHVSLGNALFALKQTEAALAAYLDATELHPTQDFLPGRVLAAKLQLCDWQGLPALRREIDTGIRAGRRMAAPFTLLACSGDGALLRQAAATWLAALVGPDRNGRPPSSLSSTPATARIRLAYVASTFHQHATAYLTAGLFERHDRSRFELFAFSLGTPREDAMHKRLRAAFDHFLELHDASDAEIARIAAAHRIDVAIDLNGLADGHRVGLFAQRLAPVQAQYLAYPGTTGATWMDYIVADRIVLPDAARAHFSEQPAWLPHSYFSFDPQRPMAAGPVDRAALGLPAQGFVYGCFNPPMKITPACFDGWMRILGAVPGSVLWLLDDNAGASGNLRREAAQRGIDPARLVFAPRLPSPEHLARHRAADLFLDTLPYNAHTTAADALWAGLPVLTCIGSAFAGRVAASLLTALGLPELITDDRAAFEALAIELGQQPDQAAALKAKLAQQRSTAPLFDADGHARALEAAWTEMHRRQRAGLAPSPFDAWPAPPLADMLPLPPGAQEPRA